MAQCISCKVSVGCGCQLTKGYCASCWLKIQQAKQKLQEEGKVKNFVVKVEEFSEPKLIESLPNIE